MASRQQTLATLALACACCIAPAPVRAQEVSAAVIDPVIVALQREIAKNYGFNVLSSPEDGAAEIGKVYYVTAPACAAALVPMSQRGTPMQVFEAMDLPADRIPTIKPRTQWVHVRLGSVLGKQARAELQAAMPGKQAELGLAFDALDQSNAQIFFGSRSVGSVPIRRAMEDALRTNSVAQPADLGNQAVGALAPHAMLLVQKFEFDREAVKRKRAGVMLKFLELFGARLSAGKDLSKAYQYELPTYSTIAFKPVTALFRDAACTGPTTNGS